MEDENREIYDKSAGSSGMAGIVADKVGVAVSDKLLSGSVPHSGRDILPYCGCRVRFRPGGWSEYRQEPADCFRNVYDPGGCIWSVGRDCDSYRNSSRDYLGIDSRKEKIG